MAREEAGRLTGAELWQGTHMILNDLVVSRLLLFYLKGFWHGWSQNRSAQPERDVPNLKNFQRLFFSQVLQEEYGIVPTQAQRHKIEEWTRDYVAKWQ
jgi:hypothetical protein